MATVLDSTATEGEQNVTAPRMAETGRVLHRLRAGAMESFLEEQDLKLGFEG